jgi:uncharacterized protein
MLPLPLLVPLALGSLAPPAPPPASPAADTATAAASPAAPAQEAFVTMDVASVGVALATGDPLALLHSEWDHLVPIWIGEVEAAAIIRALEGVPFPRPLTHDLLVSVIREMGGELEEVRVTGIRENTYLGLLRIRTSNGVRDVDTRPSDALALAVRTDARIRVARPLVDSAPDVDFISAEGGEPIVRLRGLTLGVGSGEGAEVLHVTPAVEERGIRRGDLVVEVGEAPIRRPTDFVEAVMGAGDAAVTVVRERNGERTSVRLPARGGQLRIGP